MSSTITHAFETYLANCIANGQTVDMDTYVFAHIPGLDPEVPVDPDEGLPAPELIKGEFPVDKNGVINPNAVVYSCILGTDVGTWSFNWVGLINKATQTLGMVTTLKEQDKIQSDPDNGIEGNNLIRNFVMEYTGAASASAITIPAESWQIDFGQRLYGESERVRLENLDIYGHGAFIGAGWQCRYLEASNTLEVDAGLGYVGGLRAFSEHITHVDLDGLTLPFHAFLVTSYQGTIHSDWQTKTEIRLAPTMPPSWEENGFTCYATKLAYLYHSLGVVKVQDSRQHTWQEQHLAADDPHPQYLNDDHLDTSEDPHPQYLNDDHLDEDEDPHPQYLQAGDVTMLAPVMTIAEGEANIYLNPGTAQYWTVPDTNIIGVHMQFKSGAPGNGSHDYLTIHPSGANPINERLYFGDELHVFVPLPDKPEDVYLNWSGTALGQVVVTIRYYLKVETVTP